MRHFKQTLMIFVVSLTLFSGSRQLIAQTTTWTTNGNNINNTNSGNVGIGTPTPFSTLEVNKNQNTGTVVTIDNGFVSPGNAAFSGLWFRQGGTNRFFISSINDGNTVQAGGPGAIQFWNFSNAPMLFSTNNLERMRIGANGNVGIGTSTPGRTLEVMAPNGEALRLYRNANFAGWGANMTFAFNNSNNTQVDYAGVHGIIQSNTAGSETGTLVFSTTSAGSGLVERLRILGTGDVGIGTSSPTSKLTVAGEIRSTSGGFRFPDGTVQTTASAGGGSGTVTGVTAGTGLTGGGSAGNVTVTNSDRGSSQSIFKNIADGSGTSRFTAGSNNDTIRFAGSGGTTVNFDGATKTVTVDATASTSTATNIKAGQFGLNTGGGDYTFPGNVTVVGNINAKYQDLAEWVSSSETLLRGTVVILDPNKSNQVLTATQAYDTRVAGVISDKPGIALGEGGDGRFLVATTGRVRVKVDASKAPINIGDLLVSSDTPGFATKSEPIDLGGRKIHLPGTILGKALEPLAKGQGEILVLLSLQ